MPDPDSDGEDEVDELVEHCVARRIAVFKDCLDAFIKHNHINPPIRLVAQNYSFWSHHTLFCAGGIAGACVEIGGTNAYPNISEQVSYHVTGSSFDSLLTYIYRLSSSSVVSKDSSTPEKAAEARLLCNKHILLSDGE